eukprot:TRINITY_DN1579_c0_g1_i2.p2 TRINITY_DN1579_c0_g1~~TRINITY_DN1579_c0_g1_i2.p2  ORF type:complete len:120 (+),score=26.18 TRINITY_DN1579_c0_g1_i2:120-479(+)
MPKKGEKKVRNKEVAVSRECTINLHKRTHSCAFKAKANRAVKAIHQFAYKAMGTSDVRIDTKLNKYVWSKGIRNIPRRVRVRLSRKRNEDEDAVEKMYTLVTWVPVASFKGQITKTVDE